VSLTRVQLQLVRFSILYEFVTEQRGVSEEHIFIVHSMYNQQSVWPAGIIKLAVIPLYWCFLCIVVYSQSIATENLARETLYL
jgi:uncharacterized membrane protein (DUF106 family)